MNTKCYIIPLLILMTTACASNPMSGKSQWDSINYSKIAREHVYDNDAYYSLPVGNCLEDDAGC